MFQLIDFLKVILSRKSTLYAIFIPLCFCSFNGLFSQGTLQFNRVILVGNSEEIVPAGKVWKVEAVFYSVPISNGGTSLQHDAILIDGTSVIVRYSRLASGYNYTWDQKFPFWLNAGTRLQASTNVFRISVIEFNILP